MKYKNAISLVLCAIGMFLTTNVFAQFDLQRSLGTFGGSNFGASKGGATLDSLKKRNLEEERLTLKEQKLSSLFYEQPDTSLFIFSKEVTKIPITHAYLGNPGRPSKSVVFQMDDRVGWRNGFNGFEPNILKLSDMKFFKTLRPVTKVMYIYTPFFRKTEQFVSIMHSQNIFPNFNFAGGYELVNSPGNFQNQNVNNSQYFFTAQFETTNRRYMARVGVQGSIIKSAENGGITDLTEEKLTNPDYKERYSLDANLKGGITSYNFSSFSTIINTGHIYKKNDFYFSQTYRIGSDELVCIDTNNLELFIPKASIEYSFSNEQYDYKFYDAYGATDSTFIKSNYFFSDLVGPFPNILEIKEIWRDQNHKLFFKYFFNKRNFMHYIKVGISYQNLQRLDFRKKSVKFYKLQYGLNDVVEQINIEKLNFTKYRGIYVDVDYTNYSIFKDEFVTVQARRFISGYFANDTRIATDFRKRIKKNIYTYGSFRFLYQTPETLTDSASNFNFDTSSIKPTYQKSFILHAKLGMDFPKLNLSFHGAYNRTTNIINFRKFTFSQYLGNMDIVLFKVKYRKMLSKSIPFLKNIMFRTDIAFQKILQPSTNIASNLMNLPIFWTYSSLSYYSKWGTKGKFAIGVDCKYYSDFKMDHYSFLHAKFYPQSTTLYPIRPEIGAFIHFKITKFTGFVRADFLNSYSELQPSSFTLRFLKNNVVTEGYPSQEQILRLGIIWYISN